MPKTKKKSDFVALFRVQWTSAKSVATPAALKRVDFSKGLGPALDKLEKKWDAAADLDALPVKTQTELAAQVADVQKIIRGYQQQVLVANRSDPGNGPAWWAMHEALRKIDDGIWSDMKDLGVKTTRLKGWGDKADFDRTAGKIGNQDGGPSTEEDSAEYRARGFAALERKLGAVDKKDLVGFAKALDNGVGTCLPHSRQLVKQLRGFTGALFTVTNGFAQAATAKNKPQAVSAAKQAGDIVTQLRAALPPEGRKVGDLASAHVQKMARAVGG